MGDALHDTPTSPSQAGTRERVRLCGNDDFQI